MAKATHWIDIDAKVRKRGERTGLDTLVVHALNDAYSMFGLDLSIQGKPLSKPPGEYVRKNETQRN